MTKSIYKRILLKLSGEALMGNDSFGVNPETINKIVNEVKTAKSLGVEIAIVIEVEIYLEALLLVLLEWIGQQQTIWEC